MWFKTELSTCETIKAQPQMVPEIAHPQMVSVIALLNWAFLLIFKVPTCFANSY